MNICDCGVKCGVFIKCGKCREIKTLKDEVSNLQSENAKLINDLSELKYRFGES